MRMTASSLLAMMMLLSLCIGVHSFLPFFLRHSSRFSWERTLAMSRDEEENEPSTRAAPPFLAGWIDDAGAFAQSIFKPESVSNISDSSYMRGENSGEPSGKDDALLKEIAAADADDEDENNGSIPDLGSNEDETLLEPYTDGIPTEIKDVILSSNETDSGESGGDTQKVVEGGPSSLLGRVLGDDDTSVTIAGTDGEATDEVNEEENRGDGGVVGSDNVGKDDASDTKEASPSPTIQERIAQVVTGKDANEDDSLKTTASSDGLLSLARDFKDLLLGGDEGEGVIDNLLRKVRSSSSRSSYEDDERSYDDLLRIVNEHRQSIGDTLRETFSPVDFSKLLPTSLFYYLELEDSRKNPSWKRMMHRFHPSVDIEKVEELNEQLYLAKQSYCDTVEEVREGLESAQDPLELVFCDTESFPGRPAHFVAIKKEQPQDTDYLDVLMVVRGTKSITDIITDGLLAPEDYRGGKVHAGFLRSGTYLVETHIDLLHKICKMADKERIKVKMIGHSLGAGACAVAAMEFNELDGVEAEAVGFGTPSLLSKDLAESAEEYITTVISDDDIVPRLNDITVANTVLDLMEHDWTPLAKRDIEHAFREIQRRQPALMTDSTLDDAVALVDAGIERFAKPKIKETTTDRLESVLFPPGTCIHFYRDGAGVSVTYSPCTFFSDLIISRTCLRDHLMVGGYSRIFLRVMREQDNPHFVFENCLME